MRNKVTKKNMDLDLRRYGNKLYSKAEESGGSDGGGSGEIDYEAIYQFYKKEITKNIPESILLTAIIPEHLNDVQDGIGNNVEYIDKMGIWKTNNFRVNEINGRKIILHAINSLGEVIYFGVYTEEEGGGPV